MSIKRIATLIFYLVVVIVSLVGFVYMFSAESITNKDTSVKLDDASIQKGTGIIILLSIYLTLFLALVTFLISPVKAALENPKAFVRSLVGIGVLLVVFFIGYAMAGNEVTPMYERMGVKSPGISKLIGGSLIATYIFFGVAIVVYLYSSVVSLIKQL